MKTKSTIGIVSQAVNYGERDKIITVFSLSGEKISMRARGINSPKAKLRFAGDLFSLCELEYSEGRSPLLISATPKHMFWGLRESVEKLYLACFALENMAETAEDAKFLLSCLAFLESQEYSGKLAIKFIWEVLGHLGLSFSATNCVKCQRKIGGVFSFDFQRGGFLCEECGGNEKSAILKTFQLVSDLDMPTLEKIKLTSQQEIQALKLLSIHIAEVLGGKNQKIEMLISIST